jgi:CRISPR-associated exonuclease Cas4
VEYKRGRPKAHRADEVQLCAQALCLEAMLGRPLKEGALFYGQTRRRIKVTFDADLRQLTRAIICATRNMIDSGRTPLAEYQAKRCDACSLLELCQPHLLKHSHDVQIWLHQKIMEDN